MQKTFFNRNFYVDDGIISLPSESEAISLSYEAFVPCDHNENLKKIDSDESFPRSFGLCWILKDNTLQFFVPMTEKPFTRQGLLSTVYSLFDPLGYIVTIILS